MRVLHAALLATPLLLAACAPLAPVADGGFAFGVLGDTPYSADEVRKLDAMIGRINAERLAFVVHVGDIGRGTRDQGCNDDWLEARKRQLAAIRHPFVLLPGDNEWSDCARLGMDAQARLAKWRQLFCTPSPGVAVERQEGRCENLRWRAAKQMFVGLNVPGRGRNPADARHMDTVFEWLDESLALAEQEGAIRVFVFLQADPHFERADPNDGYARLRKVLAAHANWFDGRLVLVHGDTHLYRDDQPLPGLRRLEVWGSPVVSWLRVSAPPDALRVEVGW